MKHDNLCLLRKRFIFLVILSLGFTVWVIGYRGGVGATPYDTVDSMGRTMGFNDHFSHEHYRIIVGNMNLAQIAPLRMGLGCGAAVDCVINHGPSGDVACHVGVAPVSLLSLGNRRIPCIAR
jgi:hypothetical protein